MSRRRRRVIPPASRWRTGDRCYWCGRRVFYITAPADLQATREHILPKVAGGTGEPGNVALACRSCNSKRSARTDWVPWAARHAFDLPAHQRAHLAAIGVLPQSAGD